MSQKKLPSKKLSKTLFNLMRKVTLESNGCWLFTGYLKKDGYGSFYFRGKLHQAHRASYILFIGEIPIGLTVHHICNTRNCVNPDHLTPMSLRDNMLLGNTITARNVSRKHCPKGHEYSVPNTFIRKTPYGKARECRTCKNYRRKKLYYLKKSQQSKEEE